jgi:carboxymethylenebutenolidase
MHDPDLTNAEARTITRREFVMTTLATGFAAAVQPVSASTTITTDAKGLVARDVKIAVRDGLVPAYSAMPEGGRNLPTVLVVQEIWGVHEHIKDVCRRLAKVGYLAVAPELYARQGSVSESTSMDEIRAVVAKVPDAQVMSDLDAAAAWAGANGGNPDKLAITGFCWGGRIVWLYAAHNRKLKAGVAWYGRVVGQPTDLTPAHPVDLVKNIDAPILGLYAGADAGIPSDTVERMREALRAAGKPSEIHTYPDAPHAFHADYRPSYRREAAHDGWNRLLAWFRKNGVA